MVTALILSKLTPLMVTVSPIGAAAGEKPVTFAGRRKMSPELYQPATLVTVIDPEVAPLGTVSLRHGNTSSTENSA